MQKRSRKRPFIGHRNNVIPREQNMQEGLGNDMDALLKKNPEKIDGGEHITNHNISLSDQLPHLTHINSANTTIKNTIKENIGDIESLEYDIINHTDVDSDIYDKRLRAKLFDKEILGN